MDVAFLKENHFFLVLLIAFATVFTYVSNRITGVEESARGKEYGKAIIMTLFIYSVMYMVYTSTELSEPMLHGTPDF